jgi:hypothetical protein
MRSKILSMIMSLVLLIGCLSCATLEEHKGAATGAAVGAAAGAVVGGVAGHHGHKTETAIIGGLVGGLIGGVVGHYAYDVKRNREETVQKYNYQASTGTMIRIEEVSVVPDTVYPGDKVDLGATYAVLASDPNMEVNINEIREIRRDGELVGRPEVNVTRKGSTYSSNIPLFMPKDAKQGTYRVITTIQTQYAKDSRETTFYVK